MFVLYFLAGINHFWHTEVYMEIMPSYLPYHYALVIISGVFEILFALLLLPTQTRRWAAWGIVLLLIAVFPANVQMMLNYLHEDNQNLVFSIIRLPLQILLIWWAYTFTKNHSLKSL